MLAFIDSPVGLVLAAVVILVLFGPEKLPEIGQQLGRAIRDLKRVGSEFTDSFHADDTTYRPPRYDSYGNPYGAEPYSSVPTEDINPNPHPESSLPPPGAPADAPRGDFAAPALSDPGADLSEWTAPRAGNEAAHSHHNSTGGA